MGTTRLQAIWKYVRSIYVILYGGIVVPLVGLICLLDYWGFPVRITWHERLFGLTTLPLLVYGAFRLVRQEWRARSARTEVEG